MATLGLSKSVWILRGVPEDMLSGLGTYASAMPACLLVQRALLFRLAEVNGDFVVDGVLRQ